MPCGQGIARAFAWVCVLHTALVGTACRLQAQQPAPTGAKPAPTRPDTTPRPAPRRIPNSIPDSLLRPPISPKAAFLRSLALPGLGQSGLRRSTAATVFATAEIAALYMVGKSGADLSRAKALQGLDSVTVGDPSRGETVTRVAAVPAELVNARRLHLEDWIAVLLFNHVLAGADAYVAANLWDLPARVSIRHTPAGLGLGAQFRW